jgi:activator of 2-hydroxyglutaryl-CoA dehydratase
VTYLFATENTAAPRWSEMQDGNGIRVSMDEIAAGIQLAVAKRCFVMAKKAGATDSITLTGGCAKNDGLKQAIEKVLKIKVVELDTDPQLMGALGAAEYARQKGLAKK